MRAAHGHRGEKIGGAKPGSVDHDICRTKLSIHGLDTVVAELCDSLRHQRHAITRDCWIVIIREQHSLAPWRVRRHQLLAQRWASNLPM